MSALPRVVVIGGGLAGAASAWALVRAGHTVTLVEQEARPGVHASGRNAGLIRQVIANPAVAALAREGARLLTEPPADLRAAAEADSFVQVTGSTLLAGADQGPTLRQAAETAAAAGVQADVVAPETLGEPLGVTPISAAGGGVAVLTPSDGVADPHAVLAALLEAGRRAGLEVRLETVAAIATSGGRAVGVDLQAADGTRERLDADVVVNAAGPWAGPLVVAAGGTSLRLVPRRRHLFYTGPQADVDPATPWVWDVERNFYVRPESAGLLLCACDTDERPPEDAQVDESVYDVLAERVAQVAPALADRPVARCWAGLRTFADDDGFVVGPDPALEGLFWVAALGGHGLTTSCALGLLVARGVAGADDPVLAALDPARFAPPAAAEGPLAVGGNRA